MAKKRATKKKPRGQDHPGVVLIRPDARRKGAKWRMRYVDADSGKPKWETLTETKAPLRKKRAVLKSEELAARRAKLDKGAAKVTGLGLKETLDLFWERNPRLGTRTRETYGGAIDRFLSWVGERGLTKADHVRRKHLEEFSIEMQKDESRSGMTINKDVRALRRVFRDLVDGDKFPHLTYDCVRRGLKMAPAFVEDPTFLEAADVRKVLEAALRHDAEAYKLTREEKRAGATESITPRYQPIAPFIMAVLLSGVRRNEALALEWEVVDLDALDASGRPVGQFKLKAAPNKTKRARTVRFDVSPALRRLFAAQKLRTGGEGNVFGVSKDEAIKAMRRLRKKYGAPPEFSYQVLRSTCDTFLNCSPGIFGSNAPFRAAKQLGHSVAVSEKYYAEVVAGIPADAKSLEAAMQVEDVVDKIINRVSSGSRALPRGVQLR